MKINYEKEKFIISLFRSGEFFCTEDGKIFNKKWKEVGSVSTGYKRIVIKRENISYSMAVNRIVFSLYHYEITEKEHANLVVNHKDGDKLNNHYLNLELVTESQNRKHAFVTGLSCVTEKARNLSSKRISGSRNMNAVFTEEEVKNYRDLFKNNLISVEDISYRHGIRRRTVLDMLSGRTYK